MKYYAKTPNVQGHRETVKEHLEKAAELASLYGREAGIEIEARVAALFHDTGKYTETFQDVLKGLRTGIDHAIVGACFLLLVYMDKSKSRTPRSLIEAVNGHHDGLASYYEIKENLYAIIDEKKLASGNDDKTPSANSPEEMKKVREAFENDFPEYKFPKDLPSSPKDELASMLYTRVAFSCLVDADYTASALNDDSTYAQRAEDTHFDPAVLLEKLNEFRNGIKQNSTADKALNGYRDEVFDRCGESGRGAEGLYTLTAPTGTGKTLALLNFALQHCLKHGKKRIIVVLPFLTLAEQNAKTYSEIVPNVLIDHSQSDLPESARELAARWSAPFIITTSVRFFEALFSDRPTHCRKLHNIANSVVIFDEAHSLPENLTSATLRAVKALCKKYHTTMVFSTATQPDYSTLKGVTWTPTEIIPDNAGMYKALKRVDVEWKINDETPFEQIANEMSENKSVCAIVNLRRHARQLFESLSESCPQDTIFFLTTDLCPAHRSKQIESIRMRLAHDLPCRVVATQCIEAGVDLDFDVMYRALAPLNGIIQAAGRCNRNGREAMGRVVIFRPKKDENKKIYPDDMYSNAAVIVQEMGPPFSIDDPENIREYYRRLFENTSEKLKLKDAINARLYKKVAKEYKLIDNCGNQIIVPYADERELYDRIAKQLRETGVTRALLREAAPITVTSFASKFSTYTEKIFFAGHGNSDNGGNSGIFLLLEQYEDLYSPQTGLHMPESEKTEFIF